MSETTRPMQLLVLVGSPRKNGNSAYLANQAAEAARSYGAEADVVILQDVGIRPCEGCDVCRDSVDTSCILDDGMTALYPKLREADAVLLATPIYSYNMTAQTKLLIDRLYALGGKDGNALKGKRFGFLVVYGAGDAISAGAHTAMRCLHDTFARKATWMKMVHGTAYKAGDAANNERLVKDAIQLGADLVKP